MQVESEKSAEIVDVVERLAADLGPTAFQIVDHWKVDLCAIGIASPAEPRQLAYISTFRSEPSRFSLELETPGPTDEVTDYGVAGTWDSLSYEDLRERVGDHLTRCNDPVQSLNNYD